MCTAESSQANLEDIKKKAKDLLHALQRQDVAAFRQYYSIGSLDGLSQPRLEDAQYIIAREHGFSSWQKLKEHLHTMSSSNDC